MQPSSPQKFDIISFVLGLLFFASFFGQALITRFVSIHSITYHVYELFFGCFLCLYIFYTSIKKLQQRRAKQEQVHWYNQPGILAAIGIFLILPLYLSEIVIGDAVMNSLSLPILLLLFAPSILCLLAAGYFAVRRFLGYQRSKV